MLVLRNEHFFWYSMQELACIVDLQYPSTHSQLELIAQRNERLRDFTPSIQALEMETGN